jgi:predicted flap endonuclease-1-like 5' DNA nuclease
MRRIVGALILFVVAVLPRADDISHCWIPVRQAKSSAALVSKDSSDVRRTRTRRDRTRQIVPPDYRRDPLRFLFTAPKDSLVLLPGVGPVLADRIASARTGKRSFTRWDDLLAIKGIGPKTIERLKRLADATNSD